MIASTTPAQSFSPSNKDRILNAASELLLEDGPKGLSVRAIASRAGLSTIGIYSHFKGKQGILDSLYIQAFNRLHGAMRASLEIADPKQAVLDSAKGYLGLAQEHSGEYRLIFGGIGPGYEPGLEARLAGRRAFEGLLAVVAKLLPKNASEDRQQKVALRIWAMVHGFVSLNQHTVRNLVDLSDIEGQILDAVSAIIDDIIDQHV